MRDKLKKYKEKICQNKYYQKSVIYIKENKLILFLFLINPIILSTLLKIIFENGFFDIVNSWILVIKSITIETFLDDLRFLTIIVFSPMVILEYNLIFSIQLILLGITKKIRRTIPIIAIISMILTTINYVVVELRGAAITILDLLSIGTAFNVVKGYKLDFSFTFITTCLISLLGIVIFVKIARRESKIEKRIIRGMIIILGICIFFSAINDRAFKTMNIWNLTESYASSGQILTFVKTFDNLIVPKPDDYDVEYAEKILESYKIDKNYETPDVLVIMNESYSDLKKTYNLDIKENMNFYRAEEDNVIKGNAYASVIGAKTATTEWEFLTGNTSAFIPYGAMPYIQYIKNKKESFVSVFNNNDYETTAFHSYKISGYNRESAYNNFSFKNTYFFEDMSGFESFSLDYPTDQSTYENYFNFSKDIQKDKFSFIVTMQNHSPFIYSRENAIEYLGIKEIDEYLNLINETDIALEKLIEKLKEKEKKTVLLIFGDHQPAFISKYQELFKEKEWMQNYKIPFLIWANYDIEEKENVEISTNYLSVLLSEVANTPMSSYMNFLSELKKEIPIITANGYKDKDGNIYQIKDTTSPYYELINKYNILQYYQMFDKEID